jgi:hypothetical protein
VVLCELEKAESITAAGSCLSLCVAIDYSARDAITQAAIHVNVFLSNKKPSSDLFQPLLVEALTGVDGDCGSPPMPSSYLPIVCGPILINRVRLFLQWRWSKAYLSIYAFTRNALNT